jgi:hypothetical protein
LRSRRGRDRGGRRRGLSRLIAAADAMLKTKRAPRQEMAHSKAA